MKSLEQKTRQMDRIIERTEWDAAGYLNNV